MGYLKLLLSNWKYWKYIKENKIPLWEGRFPSHVYFKHPPISEFGGKRVLNLGCGKCIYTSPNVTNLDLCEYPGINIVWDLSKTPFPFKDESFDYIIANHVLEHIPNWFECFKELERILAPGGIIEVWIPPISSDSAFTYRDHINRIGFCSFTGISSIRQAGSNLFADNEFHSLKGLKSLEMVWRGQRTLIKWWIMLSPEWLVTWMAEHLRNIISEEGFKFKKVENFNGNN